MAAGRTRVRLPGLAIGTLLLLVLAVCSLAPAVQTALAQRQRIADTQARIAAQRSELARLDADIARWNDPAYIRSEAGSRLFFVVPGQTTYRVIGTVPAAPAGVKGAAATPDWAEGVLRSIVSAGQAG